jgi:hypothetical protein
MVIGITPLNVKAEIRTDLLKLVVENVKASAIVLRPERICKCEGQGEDCHGGIEERMAVEQSLPQYTRARETATYLILRHSVQQVLALSVQDNDLSLQSEALPLALNYIVRG